MAGVSPDSTSEAYEVQSFSLIVRLEGETERDYILRLINHVWVEHRGNPSTEQIREELSRLRDRLIRTLKAVQDYLALLEELVIIGHRAGVL